MEHLQVLDNLLFDGDYAFEDSPEKVNQFLYKDSHKTDILFETDNFKVMYTYDAVPIAFGTRLVTPVYIYSKKLNKTWVQPLYRSSGTATPERTKKGQWLPTIGLYTKAYCEANGLESKFIGHLGKKFFSPKQELWVNHHKMYENMPATINRICRIFNGEEEADEV